MAPSNAVVTVLGESSTGKELVAWALHEAAPRAGKPFIPIKRAALAPAVIESELFGYEKGAFTGADARRKGTFEEAHGGTLFLDEVGELPLDLQAKLLRVLESGEVKPVGASRPFHVDVRVVAPHRELAGLGAPGEVPRGPVLMAGRDAAGAAAAEKSARRHPRRLAEHFVRLYELRGADGEVHGRAGQAPATRLVWQRARAAQRGAPRPAGAKGSQAGRQRQLLRGSVLPRPRAWRARCRNCRRE